MKKKKEELEDFYEDDDALDEDELEYRNYCIQLDDDFRIVTDPRNYILQKLKGIGEKAMWKPIYYYHTPNELLRDYTELILRKSVVKSFKDHQEVIERIVTRLEHLCLEIPGFDIKITRKRKR